MGLGDGLLMTGVFRAGLRGAARRPGQVFTIGASPRLSTYALTTGALSLLGDERFRLAVGVGAGVQVVALALGAAAAGKAPERPAPSAAMSKRRRGRCSDRCG